MQKFKKYLKSIFSEFELSNREYLLIMLKCSIIVFFQILSFIYKPIVFVELFYVIFLIVFEKYENKVLYLFFLLPFYNVFRYGTTNTQFNQLFNNILNIYFSVFVLLVLVILYFIRYIKDLIHKRKQINWINVISIFVLYLLFVLPIKSTNLTSGFSSLIVMTALFVSCYLLITYCDDIKLYRVANIWLFGVIISVFVYFLKNILPNMVDYFAIFEGRFQALQRDPNYWALELFVLLSLYTILLFREKRVVSYPFVFLILSILGLLTSSKAFFITYIIFLIMFVLYGLFLLFKDKDKLHISNMKLTWIITIIVFIFGLFLTTMILLSDKITILKRIKDFLYVDGSVFDKLNKLSTGRLSIWVNYFELIFSSFSRALFGYGIFNGYELDAIHNTFIQLLYFGGIISLILLCFILIYNIKKYKYQFKFYHLVAILPILIMSCSLDLLFSYRTYLLFFVIINCLNFGGLNKSENI